MSNRLLTVEEVSKYLNMHKITVYKMLHAGIIPAFKIGGQWRFKEEILEEWLVKGMLENNNKNKKSKIISKSIMEISKEGEKG